MAGGSGGTDWDALLDMLSACITPQEAAAVRHAAVDRGSPSHLRQLHNLVAGLLVKHHLTTWSKLHTSFPDHHAVTGALQEGLSTHCRPEREVRDAAAFAEDVAHSSRVQGDNGSSGNGASPAILARRESSGPQQPAGGIQKGNAQGPPCQLKRKAESNIEEATEQSPLHSQLANPQGPGCKRGTLADYPRIVAWWHPTENGTSLPGDFSHASSKRVCLRCTGCPNCGQVHPWHARARELTQNGRDIRCPSCICRSGSFCSCRAISASERLAAEWHEDNPSPATVHQASNKRFKWRCADAACGHVWEAQPRHRSMTGGTNCPECAITKRRGKKKKHPSVAVGRPELLAEWDEEKNTLLATEVTLSSMKKVWWLCSKCGNSWQAKVYVRAIAGRGCPKGCHLGK